MKCLLFACASLLPASATYAQGGLSAGVTVTDLAVGPNRSSQSASATSKPGYYVGAYYQFALGKRFSVVPEVQYSHEQTDFASTIYNGSTDFAGVYQLNFNYLTFPILLRMALGKRAYVEAGPQASLLVGGRQAGTDYFHSPASSSSQPVDRAIVGQYRRLDAGPCLSVGAAVGRGFGLSLRAYQGLVSLTPDPTPSYSGHLLRQLLQGTVTYQPAAR